MLTSQNLTTILTNISTQLNRYFGIFIYIFGITGNILNILVLSQRYLRTNSCALLFLYSSLANLLAIFSGLTPPILSDWAVDLTNTVGWICKYRTYVLYVSRSVGIWFITLATTDRWLLSCGNIPYGQINSLRNIKHGMMIILLLSSLLYLYVFYCYEANLTEAPQSCYGKTETCQLIGDLLFLLILMIFPISIMIIFGIMTISNLRQAQCHIQPICMSNINYTDSKNERIIKERQKRWRKTDHYLRRMLFVQVILLLSFDIPLVVLKLYSTFTMNKSNSLPHNDFIRLFYTSALLLNFVTNGISFYIYTLFGGSMFRKAFVNLVKKIFQNSQN